MLRSAHLAPLRRHATRLLLFGILAMALHALASTGLMRTGATAGAMPGAGETFVAEVCTSHGVFKADSLPVQGGSQQSDTGTHDCCKLCAAGGPLLATGGAVGVPRPPRARLNPTEFSGPHPPKPGRVVSYHLPALLRGHSPRKESS